MSETDPRPDEEDTEGHALRYSDASVKSGVEPLDGEQGDAADQAEEGAR